MNKSLGILVIILIVLLLGVFVWALCLKRKNKKLQKHLQMSMQETETVKHWKELQEAMLPAQLLELFQNGDLEKICLGDQMNIEAAVLSFNLPEFYEKIRSKTSKDMFEYVFEFVNDVLGNVVPSVLFQEGEIDRFVNAGFLAIYPKSPEGALRSAVSICETINQNEKETLQYSIGMSYGDVRVGMVGHENRFGALTISETTSLAEFLQEMAVEYGTRILISGSMKKQIPDFEKNYNSRYLGCIYLEAANIMEDLFDVYDGDELANKNGKRKTKLLFEKGVELFQKKKFYDARRHFIEVLKANRMDGAAKRYLYLCNQYLKEEDVADVSVCLEVY